MAILVTGGAGYIGGHMALRLADRGQKIVILDDMSNGVPWAIPDGVQLVVGSTGDYDLVLSIIRENEIDTILHFAATLIMSSLYDKPLEYYRINAANSLALLQAAADGGVQKFIYSATSAVYGEPEVNPIPETAKIAPTTPYGKSKLMTEYMLQDIAQTSGMKYVALRYFNVAGADPDGRYGQSTTKSTLLVQIAVQCALGVRDGLDIYGTDYPTPDGTCVRDYLHVNDLIDAHELALDHLDKGGENLTLNVGYGHGYSVRDIVDTVKQVTGRDFEVREGPRRLGDPVHVVAQADRIRKELGWQPRLDDIKTIVEHAVRWEEVLAQKKRSSDTRA